MLDEVAQIRRLPSLRRGAEAVVAADGHAHASLPEPHVRALLRMQPCPYPHAERAAIGTTQPSHGHGTRRSVGLAVSLTLQQTLYLSFALYSVHKRHSRDTIASPA